MRIRTIAALSVILVLAAFGSAKASVEDRSEEHGMNELFSVTRKTDLGLNQSYLDQTKTTAMVFGPVSTEIDSALSLNEGWWQGVKRDYEGTVKHHEYLERHDLIGPIEALAYINAMRGYSDKVIGEIKSAYLKKHSRRLKAAVDRDEILSAVKRPAVLIAGAIAIYNGQEFEIKIAENASVKSRAEVPSGKGAIALDSTYVKAGVELVSRAPSDRNPFNSDLNHDNPFAKDERLRFSVSKGISAIDAETGFTYGTTTRTVTAFVSKRLTPNLVLTSDASRSLRAPTGARNGEETVRLGYSFNF